MKTNMVLPPKLAQAFITHIDLDYLNQYEGEDIGANLYFQVAKICMTRDFKVHWSMGGTIGSCYTSKLKNVISEEEPEMEKLVSFFKSYFPKIDHQTQNKIISQSQTKISEERDYYGGKTSMAVKNISFKQLANAFIKFMYKDESKNNWVNFDEILKQHSEIVPSMTLKNYYLIDFNQKLTKKLKDKSNHKVSVLKI